MEEERGGGGDEVWRRDNSLLAQKEENVSQLCGVEIVCSQGKKKMVELLCGLFTVHNDSALFPSLEHTHSLLWGTVRFI